MPVQVLDLKADAIQVSAGRYDTCAVLSSGHVKCWGEGEEGQLGDGGEDRPRQSLAKSRVSRTPRRSRPVRSTACAVLSTRSRQVLGLRAGYGDLGGGQYRKLAHTPVEVQGLTTATQIAAANEVSCALLSRRTRWNAGAGTGWGQLGDSNFESSDVPIPVKHLANAVQITAGEHDTCAVLSGGHVDCWGYNADGELGSGRSWSEVPTEVLGVSLFAEPPDVETGAAEEVTAETAVLHGRWTPGRRSHELHVRIRANDLLRLERPVLADARVEQSQSDRGALGPHGQRDLPLPHHDDHRRRHRGGTRSHLHPAADERER